MPADIVVVHPGVQHSADLAASFHAEERLLYLVTRLQIGRDAAWPWGSARVRAALSRRVANSLDDAKIVRVGVWSEILGRLLARWASPELFRRFDRWSIRRFSRLVVQLLPQETAFVVGTDTASRELFETIKRVRPDIVRVLDVSHPLDVVVQRLIAQDAQQLGTDPRDYDDYHAGPPVQQVPELQSADAVIVASSFSANSLAEAGFSREKVWVVPYGVECPAPRVDRVPATGLRLLAVGALSERKGATILLEAMRGLWAEGRPIELTIAGREAAGYSLPPNLPENTRFVASPPPDELELLYAAADVLVLPSMCEGFGRTILEALAAGCSVVTTDRTGGPDILEIAPFAPITVVRVSERLERLPTLLAEMASSPAAYLRPEDARRAAQIFSADRYRATLVEALDQIALASSSEGGG